MHPRFFPQYWRSTRPFSKQLAARQAEAAKLGGIRQAEQSLFQDIVKAASAAGVVTDRLMAGNFLSREAMLGQTLAQWELHGAHLVEVAPALVEALRHSDVGDMRLEDLLDSLKQSVYLHFGPQPTMPLHGGRLVEGLLVLSPANGNVRMLLVGRAKGLGWTHIDANEAQMLRFRLVDMAALGFDQAVEAAVELDIEDIRQARSKLSTTPSPLGTEASWFDTAEAQQRENRASYVLALQLAGNVLAYMGAYPSDSQELWQSDTPATLREKASRPGKEGVRADSKLRSMGFRPVRLVGAEFERADFQAETGSSRSPHWRRGHWRHQAHGPQMSLRRLIWIRPMRILGSGPNAGDEAGR